MQFLRQCRHVLIPIWAFSIGLGVEELGLIQSISAAIDMTLFYPVGLIMDKYGRKWTSVPSIILLSLGFIFMTYVDSFNGLMLVGLLLGFANGLGSGAMLTLGSDLSPKKSTWILFGNMEIVWLVWKFCWRTNKRSYCSNCWKYCFSIIDFNDRRNRGNYF